MPEGPEVETVVRTLNRLVKGLKITSVNIYYDNIIEYPNKDIFIANITNQTINNITRRGKWILFELDNYYLLSHLRMEGKYFLKDKEVELLKHEHVVFNLSNNNQLRYHDVRKFGKFHLVKKEDITNYKVIKELGIDPFEKDFTSKYLLTCFNKSNLPIKSLLLDQRILLGVGNIYANEILFLSRLNPLIIGKNIKLNDCIKIVENTKKTLEAAIEKGGTTIKSYTSAEGVTGLFQHELLVHGKKVCPNCSKGLLKIKINGRGTYYCEVCQK